MLQRDLQPLAPLLVGSARHDDLEELLPLPAELAALVTILQEGGVVGGQLGRKPQPLRELVLGTLLEDEDEDLLPPAAKQGSLRQDDVGGPFHLI